MYFDQFNIIRLITLQVGAYQVSFTNFSMTMLLVICIILLVFRSNDLVPNRWQLVIESVYGVMRRIVQENLGMAGQKFFPFVMCLFLFLVMLNVLGLFPYVFTPTAQIVMTFGLSLSIVMAVIILGLINFKGGFLSMLMPAGVPYGLAPFLVIIETLSFMVRAISLGVRLAANISAGHLLFGIIAGFAFTMLSGGLVVLSLIPIMILIFITLLEIMVAVIQAYVFSLLTTIYLGDTVVLH